MIVKRKYPRTMGSFAVYLMEFNVWIFNLLDKDMVYIDTFFYGEAEKILQYYPEIELFSTYRVVKISKEKAYPDKYAFYSIENPDEPLFYFEILKKRKLSRVLDSKRNIILTAEIVKEHVPKHLWDKVDTYFND